MDSTWLKAENFPSYILILESEQEEQDSKIDALDQLLKELNEQFASQLDVDQQRASDFDELKKKVDEIEEKLAVQTAELAKCATWGQIEDSFKKDFFNEDIECASCQVLFSIGKHIFNNVYF